MFGRNFPIKKQNLVNRIIVLLLVLVLVGCLSATTQIPFNKKRWDRNYNKYNEVRLAMTDDIINTIIQKQLTKPEIIAWLGKNCSESDNRITYFVCPDTDHIFGLEAYELLIHFDEHGFAKDAYVIHID